ncbi:alanine racemase [Sulfurovum sp. bin170]|uniref:alanine racemase n=1 Tax=Sulfurovum sp. bin170 TaxID=2695268 RepID=UPI0013DE9BF8|nr:alanine racemase [Sulfurovum sp. bin170]NEW60702.1 alanine racemase [Sulfurovum sp. bin170]
MAYIKIERQNFFHNLSQFLSKTGSKESIGIVLKDNAYGHGLELMAKLSSEFGLTQAVVRTYDEAKEIKKYFEQILVLGDKAIIDDKCSFTLNSLDDIKIAQKGSTVELKVDTGMHRNGISMSQLEEALTLIRDRDLNLKGIMTHNRSADELSSELFWQQKSFEDVRDRVGEFGFKDIRFHSYNSATSLRLGCSDEDMIRLGIGAYGYSELPKIYDSLNLKPVLSLWARKISTRVLKKGERVGYGGTFIAPREMIVSTYDLGYGDGWMRSSTMKPFVTAEGLSILGRVSMDYISLESSKDEVCIVGNALFAGRQIGTISYEIMTQLSEGMDREVV